MRHGSSTTRTRRALHLCCCCFFVVFFFLLIGTASGRQRGWVVGGRNATTPACGLCLNALGAPDITNRSWAGVPVGMYRCVKMDSNEMWVVDADAAGAGAGAGYISLTGFGGETLCVDAAAELDRTRNFNDVRTAPFLPLRLQHCDGSPTQRWLWDSALGYVRSGGVTDPDDGALYMVRTALAPAAPGFDVNTSAYYNLVLATAAAAAGATEADPAAGGAFSLVPVPATGYTPLLLGRSPDAAAGDDNSTTNNLVFNGGFERSTLLDRWPAWQNCSSGDQAEEKCVKTVWFPGELFSLCSWSVGGGGGVAAPDWVRAPAAAPPGWTAARGAAALLLRANAAVAQAVPTRPGGRYRLSLAVMVGYLARLDAHGDGGGWAFAECARPAGGGYVAVQLGDGATPVLLGATTGGGEEDGQGGAATTGTRWVERRVGFTAVGEVTVVVVGGSGFGACGPLVDDVRVEEVGEDGGGAGDDRDGVAGGGGGGGRNKTVVAACTVAAAAVVAATAAAAVGGPRLWRRWRRRGREETAAAVMREVAGGGEAAQAAAGHRVKAYSYAELGKATAGWTTVVARGGFSTVYRAELPDGTVAAVKVEKSAAEDDDDAAAKDPGPPDHEQEADQDQEEEEQHSNRAELWVLLRVNHRFLVSVTGICHDRPTAALVLEYLPNGTLHQRLHHHDKDTDDKDADTAARRRHGPLSWPARMKIIYQVTCALEYLHHGASPPTVHRDVKSANILLTATDSAKLADFGLSRAVTTVTAASTASTRGRQRRGGHGEVKGSLGYLDPTYLRTGAYSLKSDVYSYGVLLLETVSGHTAIKDGDLLAAWAAPFMQAAAGAGDADAADGADGANLATAMGIVDPRVPTGDVAHADLRTLLLLARACVQDEPARRPGMDRALATLTEARFSGCPPASPVAVPHAILAGFSGLASDDQLTSRGSTSVGSGSVYTPSSLSSGSVF